MCFFGWRRLFQDAKRLTSFLMGGCYCSVLRFPLLYFAFLDTNSFSVPLCSFVGHSFLSLLWVRSRATWNMHRLNFVPFVFLWFSCFGDSCDECSDIIDVRMFCYARCWLSNSVRCVSERWSAFGNHRSDSNTKL
jgi:hypothetical protein